MLHERAGVMRAPLRMGTAAAVGGVLTWALLRLSVIATDFMGLAAQMDITVSQARGLTEGVSFVVTGAVAALAAVWVELLRMVGLTLVVLLSSVWIALGGVVILGPVEQGRSIPAAVQIGGVLAAGTAVCVCACGACAVVLIVGLLCEYAQEYLQRAGYTARQLTTGGYTVRTTLDPRVSDAAKAAVDTNVPPAQDGVTNAFVVLQPGQAAHEVLAMVANRSYGLRGNNGETSTNVLANAADVFGGGSTFKVFTTAAALESRRAGLETLLPNPSSACIPQPGGGPCYSVHNAGRSADPITLANALAISPNTAFVALEAQVGTPQVLDMASSFGLRQTLQTNDAGRTPVTDATDPRSRDPQYRQPQLQYLQNTPSITLGDSPSVRWRWPTWWRP